MHSRTITWLLLLSLNVAFGEQKQDNFDWQPWSDAVFAQAKKEGRFVLLNLGAVWCHWCHVMDEITYQDPKVIEPIRSHYVAVLLALFDIRLRLAGLRKREALEPAFRTPPIATLACIPTHEGSPALSAMKFPDVRTMGKDLFSCSCLGEQALPGEARPRSTLNS